MGKIVPQKMGLSRGKLIFFRRIEDTIATPPLDLMDLKFGGKSGCGVLFLCVYVLLYHVDGIKVLENRFLIEYVPTSIN